MHDLHSTYLKYKELSIQGRYVVNQQILDFIKGLGPHIFAETIGLSVQKRTIQSLTMGSGKIRILMWSQMHGNESTTTKAVLDLINFLSSNSVEAQEILAQCTLKIIPILNPDGAEAYTRVNANEVDLNRDAQELSQPESKILRKVFDQFQPNFCFNLHDQRTIYNVGSTRKPATVSFLAPAHDEDRNISKTRDLSMRLIVAMNQMLQEIIPGQVGRYDDSFNANCVGDTFQMLETPTILFEAGHYPEDYKREMTRDYIFLSLLTAVRCIAHNTILDCSREDYFGIPENQKRFLDIIIKNANMIGPQYTQDIGILFLEVLDKGEIRFDIQIQKIESIEGFYAHRNYDCVIPADMEVLKTQPYWQTLSK